jgi:Kdo2-lipid IVA lauroyltransferase/acyltransferase
MIGYFVNFIILRFFLFVLSFLPFRAIHAVGKVFGQLIYHLFPDLRKRALSNLSLATDLHLEEQQIITYAKESIQNLAITCLEYGKLSRQKKIQTVASCVNPKEAENLLKQGKGVIFFCGHLSNWEVLFLEGTTRMPGVAIGRPIKNHFLYRWITQIRQKFGGTMIPPKSAAKEGLRFLKRGYFLGIVGDQGMPDSSFSSSFLGRRAWTSPLPGLLSYKTGCPLIVATTKRLVGRYEIHYSAPLFPDQTKPLEEEVGRLMRTSLHLLEEAICDRPGEWLWTHNRWKQRLPGILKKPFRYETILIILPQKEESFFSLFSHLDTFREIYSREWLTFLTPKAFAHLSFPEGAEILSYEQPQELFRKEFRFKLIFDFTNYPKLKSHFLKRASFSFINLKKLEKMAGGKAPLSTLLHRAIYAN